MLLSFSVKNYRSYKEETKIEFIPTIRKKSKDDYRDSVKTVKLDNKELEVLNTSFIYGYNGTGKSNLIRGMFNLKSLLSTSRNDDTPDFLKDFYDPFLFDNISQNQNSHFSIQWLMEKSKDNYKEYSYKLAFNNNEIYEEELKIDNNLISLTDMNPNSNRKDIPILTKLAKEGNAEIKPIFDYLIKNIIPVNTKMFHITTFFNNYKKDVDFKKRADKLIRKADFGIENLEISEQEIEISNLDKKTKGDIMSFLANSKYARKDGEKIIQMTPTIIHKIKNTIGETINSFSMNFEEESKGTKDFMAILYHIYKITKDGGTLCIDEFTSYLHPALVMLIINLFKDESSKGQLIITTHDLYLLDKLDLRRDQIWITDKTVNSQETSITRISDEEGRSEINMADRFMLGLYGSIPPNLTTDL